MMSAGKYYIGDLCYVLNNKWDEFCNLTIDGNDLKDGEFELNDGTRFATYTTYYGDGNYKDQSGRSYGVDAGLIGCVAIEDITDPDADFEGGNVIDFPLAFETGSQEGELHFGHIVIETRNESDNNEEDKEEDDDM